MCICALVVALRITSQSKGLHIGVPEKPAFCLSFGSYIPTCEAVGTTCPHETRVVAKAKGIRSKKTEKGKPKTLSG